jgi:hypothetical protein
LPGGAAPSEAVLRRKSRSKAALYVWMKACACRNRVLWPPLPPPTLLLLPPPPPPPTACCSGGRKYLRPMRTSVSRRLEG